MAMRDQPRHALAVALVAMSFLHGSVVSRGVSAANGVEEGDPAGPTVTTGGEDSGATPIGLPADGGEGVGEDADAGAGAAASTGSPVVPYSSYTVPTGAR